MLRRIGGALLASIAAAAALTQAASHPVTPSVVLAATVFWVLIVWWRPDAWLLVLPALLPLANFAPWTGWIAFEEFDLLALGAIAAGHARMARDGDLPTRSTWIAVVGLLLFCVPGIVRGVLDARSIGVTMFDGYVDPINTWRVAKSAVFALAMLPMIERASRRDALGPARLLSWGMVCGLAVVSVIVLWERAMYPGLLDTETPYRVTALFWEMHVGGAAIDAFLALAAPFAAWMVWQSHSRLRWLLAALLALLVCHACLVTFSRGVYGAVALPVVALSVWLWARRWLAALRWRVVGGWLLGLALVAEIVVVLMPGSFMSSRMAQSSRDYGSRLAHWTHGVDLLHGVPDWALGLGLGRLPPNYARFTAGSGLSGSARLERDEGVPHVHLTGSRDHWRYAGTYSLTQQVPMWPDYRLRFEVRNPAGADLLIYVCESHLLYDGECQGTSVSLPVTRDWQPVDYPLPGPSLDPGPWPHRAAVLSISVRNLGVAADLRRLTLTRADGSRSSLVNGDFRQGLRGWWPNAQFYFLPWHIDNLYLELLIERGLLGLMLAAVASVGVMWRLARLAGRRGDDADMAPFFIASLAALAMIGAVSSVLDVPRVAWLAMIILSIAWQLGRRRNPDPSNLPPPMQ